MYKKHQTMGNDRTETHHSCEQACVSMSFILIPLSRVDFDNLEFAVLAIPVEDAFHAPPIDATPRIASMITRSPC
jgi:hypothetical protein